MTDNLITNGDFSAEAWETQPIENPPMAWALSPKSLIAALRALPSDKLRLEVLSEFCCDCGSTDPRCQCENNE